MRVRSFLFTIAVTLFVAQSAVAARPPINDVVNAMQQVYRDTKDLTANFQQVYTDVLYERKRHSTGTLFVKKPGMLRWEYTQPEKKSFIADGKELWLWEPDEKQAFRNPLNTENLSSGLTFLLGAGDLQREFVAQYAAEKDVKIGPAGDLVVKLVPRQPTAQYEFLLVAINPQSHLVDETMILTKHSRNHFTFKDIKLNSGLTVDRFRFKPSPGVRVIDTSKATDAPQ